MDAITLQINGYLAIGRAKEGNIISQQDPQYKNVILPLLGFPL